MKTFLLQIFINIVILAVLFVISENLHVFPLLVFSAYGIVVSLANMKSGLRGITNSFNGMANMVGNLIAMRLYGPKAVIAPFVPKNNSDNIRFNSNLQKISSGFSFLFWLLAGSIIEILPT